MIRQINRKPSNFFLINGKASEESVAIMDDDPFFDDFIVIDREELQKKLKLELNQDKLDKEEHLKNNSESVLV